MNSTKSQSSFSGTVSLTGESPVMLTFQKSQSSFSGTVSLTTHGGISHAKKVVSVLI